MATKSSSIAVRGAEGAEEVPAGYTITPGGTVFSLTPGGTKHVEVKNELDMPTRYSETPGGTAFLFTPGGTKIVYERRYLLKLKNSPLSKTPCKLPVIPGVTLDDEGNVIEEEDEVMPIVQEAGKSKTPATREEKPAEPEEALFDMEM